MSLSSTTSNTAQPVQEQDPGQEHEQQFVYDGHVPFPDDVPAPPRDRGARMYVSVTAAIVVLPFVVLGLAGWLLWGRLIHPVDIVVAVVFYTVTCLGVTVGFHRGLTHGGYRAVRPLRIALAIAGS